MGAIPCSNRLQVAAQRQRPLDRRGWCHVRHRDQVLVGVRAEASRQDWGSKVNIDEDSRRYAPQQYRKIERYGRAARCTVAAHDGENTADRSVSRANLDKLICLVGKHAFRG